MRVGGGEWALYPGIECPPLLQVNRDEIEEYPLERFSETSNNQAIINPFYHNKKWQST